MTSFNEEYSSTTTIIDEEFDSGGSYPTAFGITFTPPVIGVSLGIVGGLAMGYVLLNFFMPAFGEYAQLKADETAKKVQLEQQSPAELMRRLANAEVQLQEAEQRKSAILQLYGDSQELDTILYNFNNLFTARNVSLTSFLPDGDPVVIADDSLGTGATNQLKRQTYNISMVGSFSDTLGLIRDIERLQPLILMRNLRSSLVQTEFPVNVIRSDNTVTLQTEVSENVTTDMTLEVLMPLTPEERAALAPPPPEEGGEAETTP